MFNQLARKSWPVLVTVVLGFTIHQAVDASSKLATQPNQAPPPTIGTCSVFPADNPWNMVVTNLPVLANSPNYIASINANKQYLHADFGVDQLTGIPYVVVPGSQPKVPITFTNYGDESDPGPYPVPLNAPVEAGGDRHVLTVDGDNCKLYELYKAYQVGAGWNADSAAIFDFTSNALRPLGWTSADAAGLPIFPGLVRYDEIVAGAINHALRFTVQSSQMAYILPATHFASKNTNPNLPPMGLRVRLKASFDISGYTGASKIILQALKTYGMIVADNGSSWYISGATDPNWDDNDLNQLKRVPGSEFEAVYTGTLITNSSTVGTSPTNAAPPPHRFTTSIPTLTWNRITWAVRYDVEISENAAFTGAVKFDAGNNLSFTWPSPLPDAPYYWHVRACSTAVTCGTWSSPETFVVDAP